MTQLKGNLLTEDISPSRTTEQFYDPEILKKQIFSLVSGEESHVQRRRQIIKDHPEVVRLLVPDKPYSMIIAVCLVLANLCIGYFVKVQYKKQILPLQDQSWAVIMLIAYFPGAIITHTLQAALIHDFTHFSGHKSILVNKAFAIFCNIAIGVPASMSFMRYHADHHNYLGVQGKDADLPTEFEANIGKKNFLMKLIFALLFPVFYVFRPLLVAPKKFVLDELINILVIVCTNLIIVRIFGSTMLLYLIISGVLAISIQPTAGHTIAEHFEFVEGLETYDYLGVCNFFNLNLGYHTEHHDFPNCPWYNLPKIRALAPEYYERLPYHTSYLMVYWKFLFDPNFNLYNRTLRVESEQVGRQGNKKNTAKSD